MTGDWLLIDDSPEEAASFATGLSKDDALKIAPMGAQEAAVAINAGNFSPSGVLMDVDLSNEKGSQQSGPGMAQDIRVAQQKRAVPGFPIVRFSLRDKVLENIGHDSSSDDIFDLKIEKDGLSTPEAQSAAQAKLIGVRQLYDALIDEGAGLLQILGLAEDQWCQWGSTAFQSDFDFGDRVHLKAGPLVRMLIHPGLLIDEDMLAVRLGVDLHNSKGWKTLAGELEPYTYRGVSSECFPRWWARGIEDWWQEKVVADVPLAGFTIAQRMEHLTAIVTDLVPLQMPKGSLGDRPWRYCLLSKEAQQQLVPIDPARAVKVKPRSNMPPWLDPLYAALGVALQNREDPRLDKEDLKRLQIYLREA
ncbi:hypothetical protein H7F51_15785 [Novosphingobium flavum]|uniref:Uncharacterized protein n=1 Tax=Novosphingobium flavum TaxID=1778672 RepID=A0A7X1FU12_9SPHN|nr:hypothetical protein [Novosphingobium flavum]MBC2666979.1 hypothetical protein [Novosphingobium flavum]